MVSVARKRHEEDALPLERLMALADFRGALRRFLRHSERVASRHRLTPQRYLLLLMIKGAADGSERITVGAVADRLQLGVNTTTELVDRAEASGLVVRERSDDDARRVYLRVTAEGQRRLRDVVLELEADREQLERALEHLTRSYRRARP